VFGGNRPSNLAALLGLGPASGEPAERWDALDRFARDLPRCQGPVARTARFLRAAQAALGADLVYCCSSTGAGPVEVARVDGAIQATPPGWCQALVRHALAEAPGTESQLLRSHWSPPARLGCPSPCSLAMVRLSKSRSIWAVALGPPRQFGPADMTLLVLARHLLANAHRHAQMQGQLRDMIVGLVQGVTTGIDARDHYTAGHSARVARIAARLGEQMGLSAADVGDLHLAGLLHDIGTVGTKDGALQKPGPLTPEEMAQVKEHPILGAAMVAQITPIAHLAPIVRGHHERCDGQGYPDGLAGEDVPLLARVLAVADGCDALMADRPYRAALGPAQIDATLMAGAGSQWDQRIVRHLLACRDDVYALGQPGPARAREEVC
jgi:putative nucleotidyltransferase with HDIG domain